MKMPKLLVAVGIAVIATVVLYLAFQDLSNTFIGVTCVAVALAVVGWLVYAPRPMSEISEDGRIVGVGTVCTIGDDEPEAAAGKHQIMIEVTGGKEMCMEIRSSAIWLIPMAIRTHRGCAPGCTSGGIRSRCPRTAFVARRCIGRARGRLSSI